MPLGPSQSYLAKFNDYILPGYVQSETFDSVMDVAPHYAAYKDGSNTEVVGLQNKALVVRLKVWEQDYITVKDQIELAASMLRSRRNTFAPLYLQYSDKYYSALVKTIRYEKSVPSSVRIAEYEVEFECKPWLYGDSHVLSLNGTGTVDTDSVARTISNGGWTPTNIQVVTTGAGVISGVTSDNQDTGLIEINGATGGTLQIDTEEFTAVVGTTNRNDLITSKDYSLWVGAGKTTFTVAGNVSSITIQYLDRWYI